jgi:hypothetical protein
MWYDELHTPLGQDPVRKRASRGKAIVLASFLGGGSLAAAAVCFMPSVLEQSRPAAWASIDTDFSLPAEVFSPMPAPSAEPYRATDPSSWQEESETKPPLRLPFAGTFARRAETAAESIDDQSGVKIIRAGGADAPGPLIIDVAKALSAQAAAVEDSGMIEKPLRASSPRIRRTTARP